MIPVTDKRAPYQYRKTLLLARKYWTSCYYWLKYKLLRKFKNSCFDITRQVTSYNSIYFHTILRREEKNIFRWCNKIIITDNVKKF